MTVPFANIPSNIRTPLFYAEVDNSLANTAQFVQRALIIGQKTSAGTAVANTPVISQGVTDAMTQGGPGSMLHLMTEAYRANDTFGEVWYLPLADADAAGATAATGSINITHVATANGTLYLYIGGIRVAQLVTTSQTAAQIATALAATVNATIGLPVSAAVDGVTTSKVNFTALNAGAAGNDIDLRVNYLGLAGGESLPAGLTYTIVAMTGGATNPSLTTALTNCSDQPFDFIVCPYTDSTSLNALKSFLSDTSGRWSWTTQIYGHVFAAYRSSYANCVTFGTARNNQHETVMGFNDSPTPNWIWAAAMTGAAAVSLRADPALPMQTLAIQGVLAPPLASRFALSDRNTLLFDGISTFIVGQDGTVYIENLITTYQKNAFNNPDNSYLQVETMFTLMYILRALKTVVTSKYARKKLAANGTRSSPGANVVTPNLIRADLIAQYRQLEEQGLVEQSDSFADALIVERNANNPSRVDVLYPPTLIAGLRIFALLAQFRLQ